MGSKARLISWSGLNDQGVTIGKIYEIDHEGWFIGDDKRPRKFLMGHWAEITDIKAIETGKPTSKYNRQLKGVTVDVYDVLKAFDVKCPALQHLAKKALCAGLRGHKDRMTDLQDIVASAHRAVELEEKR